MNLLPKWLRIPKIGDAVKIQESTELVSSSYRGKIAIVMWVGDKTCQVRVPLENYHVVLTTSKYEVDVI